MDQRTLGSAGQPRRRIANQLWLSAVGLNPQQNPFYALTYPWLGFRVGVIGEL